MAIRVRCTGCSKKVSVDDAFAGGACRCPYCKEIVLVDGAPAEKSGPRPYAPVERPETPDEMQREEPGPVPALSRDVPLARPVRIQGIITLVLIGSALAMIVGAIWAGIVLSGANKEDANQPFNSIPGVTPGAPAAPAPAQPGDRGDKTPQASAKIEPPARARPSAEGPLAADVKIAAPVIYVLDCGGSMKNVFDYARFITRASILSLGSGGNFDVVLSTEGGEKSLAGAAGGFRAGGKDGEAAAKTFLAASPEGTCDIEKAIGAAIARRPRTIVLLRRGEVPGAKELAEKAKAANVKIVALGLASDSDAKESFSQLTGPTGGQAQVFSSEGALSSWVDQQPSLE
jgi:DNA-directed RNA polymerase subunit RPC12/RpoP